MKNKIKLSNGTILFTLQKDKKPETPTVNNMIIRINK